jgi:hypothetical protein
VDGIGSQAQADEVEVDDNEVSSVLDGALARWAEAAGREFHWQQF